LFLTRRAARTPLAAARPARRPISELRPSGAGVGAPVAVELEAPIAVFAAFVGFSVELLSYQKKAMTATTTTMVTRALDSIEIQG